MTGPLLLAIDQGTTNTKAVIFRPNGGLVAHASSRVSVTFPQSGWVQTDAVHLLATVVEAVRACWSDAGNPAIAAIGVSNQRESVVMWDAHTGEALGPVVSWQCGRGLQHCEPLRAAGHEARVREITGLPLDPMFSAPKLAWLLDSIDDGRGRAARGEVKVGTVDSWLLWHLTDGAVHATDLTNASRTLLLDLSPGAWSPPMLDAFGIPAECLPAVHPCTDHYGVVGRGLLAELAGTPVTALAGDSHAALVGHGALMPGTLKATFGTGTSVMGAVPRGVRAAGLATTIGWSCRRTDGAAHVVEAIEGNIYATGAALEWTAQLLGLGHDVAALEALAVSAEAGAAGVVFVPALAGLGAPHWAPSARGALDGLTLGIGRAEVAAATFDAVAHQVADVVDAVAAASGNPVRELAADGGAMRSAHLAQRVADLTGAEVLRAEQPEVAALGVALLAGLGAGVFADVDAISAVPRPTTRFVPSIDTAARSEARELWRRAVGQVVAQGGGHGSA